MRPTADRALRRLGSVPLLRALPPDRLEFVCDAARLDALARGRVAYAEHDPADWVGIVEHGAIRTATQTADGKRAILWVAGPGESFGERALLEAGSLRSQIAEAAQPSEIWRLPASVLRGELERDPAAAAAVVREFAAKLHAVSAAFEDMVARDVRGRIARRLCDLADRFGVPAPPGAITVEARVTHEDLADMVGASREAVSRTLAEFRAQGWLEERTPRGRQVVADLDALRTAAGLA